MPVLVLLYVQDKFDQDLITQIHETLGINESKSDFLKNVGFTLASLIDAKTVILNLQECKEFKDDNENLLKI